MLSIRYSWHSNVTTSRFASANMTFGMLSRARYVSDAQLLASLFAVERRFNASRHTGKLPIKHLKLAQSSSICSPLLAVFSRLNKFLKAYRSLHCHSFHLHGNANGAVKDEANRHVFKFTLGFHCLRSVQTLKMCAAD